MKKFLLFLNILFLIALLSVSCNGQPVRLITGGYAKAGEKGLKIFDLNYDEGAIKLISETDAGPNPTYFCFSKKHGNIYAANEVMSFNGVKGGGITTLDYNSESGNAVKLNQLAVPNGGPCFISLSESENFLFLANYSGGSVVVVRLSDKGIPVGVTDSIIYRGEEGAVSHAHMISSGPTGNRVYVADLGLDRIVIYTLNNETGKLNQIKNGIVKLAKGSGPRHFVFSKDGTKLYVICELNSTVSVFNVSSGGELSPIQTITTLSDSFKGDSFCADIHMAKDGKFLYGSNRGENTIVTFRIKSDGTLILAGRASCGGNWPRNFVIDPSGKFILVGNQRSGNISIFRIDEKTGIPLEPATSYRIADPACLKFFN